jgi:hypothetical protein
MDNDNFEKKFIGYYSASCHFEAVGREIPE